MSIIGCPNVDVKAHRAICDKYGTNGCKGWDGGDLFFADILEAYEAAKTDQPDGEPRNQHELRISLCEALYPGGIKHPQQSEWWSMIEKVRSLKRESGIDVDALKKRLDQYEKEAWPQKSWKNFTIEEIRKLIGDPRDSATVQAQPFITRQTPDGCTEIYQDGTTKFIPWGKK